MITVQAGQCGNQLGYCLLQSLHQHLDSKDHSYRRDHNYFFRSNSQGQYTARAVCLDTEPKVIHDVTSQAIASGQWKYDEQSVAYRHGGAGNNWALGYQMCSGEFIETALNCIQRELERIDVPPSILVIHSIGGGTGSGLGTRLTEQLSDHFSRNTRVNLAIMPYHFGEVVVQSYNALLCLSKIASKAHAVMLFENEVAVDLCKRMRGIQRPTLFDINQSIVSNVVAAVLPTHRNQRPRPPLIDDVMHLCSHPGYRFISTKSTPQTSASAVDFTYDSWSSLLSTVQRMTENGVYTEKGLHRHHEKLKSLASSIVLRGPDAATAGQHLTAADARLATSPHITNKYHRTASMMTNNQAILPLLMRTTSKASALYEARAYLHQYHAYGIENDDFVGAFRNLGSTIQRYRDI